MKCARCGDTDRLFVNNKRKLINGEVRYTYYCANCNTIRLKKYRSTIKGREAQQRANNAYELRNPNRLKAWRQAAKASMGKYEKCLKCNLLGTHKHHPDPLSPLIYIFLCPYHHKQEHKLTK